VAFSASWHEVHSIQIFGVAVDSYVDLIRSVMVFLEHGTVCLLNCDRRACLCRSESNYAW
jgi:hypothetical protein